MMKVFIPILVSIFLAACGGGSNDTSELETPDNSSPTGSVSINGTSVVGQRLTASNNLADLNGLGVINHQWQRTINGAVSDLVNQTSSTYTILSDDIGYTLSVVASYIDGDGFNESVSSANTPIVVANDQTTSKPNILLIIADDQGVDASAQYNYSTDLPNTPTIDQFAAEGIVFDNAWATPACTTTRGTLITGEHGINSGVSFLPAELDSSTFTLQRYLKSLSDSSNYQTAVIGKWHLGGGMPDASHPTDSGVDYYAGTIAGVIDDYNNWELTIDGEEQQSTEYHTSKMTALAIDWLATQHQQDNPWFLWLAYIAPHSPFHLPPADLHNRNELSGSSDHINANRRDYYYAALEAMDTEIARLLSSMNTAQRNNTIIIYIGDNGTPAGVIDQQVYARNHSKGSLYEGGIRIPMIVSGNGVSRMGERETALVNTSDFYATFGQLIGGTTKQINDSYSFMDLLSSDGEGVRQYNYSEFESNDVTGWTVRDNDYKYIEFTDGTKELYKISEDLAENNDLLLTNENENNTTIVEQLSAQGRLVRGESSNGAIDITDAILTNRSANCSDYIKSYQSTVTDINQGTIFNGALTITESNDKCVFQTNNIPNHDFNDGDTTFANNVSEQNNTFKITSSPIFATSNTELSLRADNALLLNGVKVDLLAAACFGVGDEKIGCNDINQPWRFDPAFSATTFRIDSHNAHTQPDGSYHYHGKPNALYSDVDSSIISPMVGFAADGFPIFGSYIEDNVTVRKVVSSYQLKSGDRSTGNGNPGGTYDGTYRDDYEYIVNSGDLDECNGMTIGGIYSYYITDGFPYVLNCYKGTPDESFNK